MRALLLAGLLLLLRMENYCQRGKGCWEDYEEGSWLVTYGCLWTHHLIVWRSSDIRFTSDQRNVWLKLSCEYRQWLLLFKAHVHVINDVYSMTCTCLVSKVRSLRQTCFTCCAKPRPDSHTYYMKYRKWYGHGTHAILYWKAGSKAVIREGLIYCSC